jgi:predicted ATPase with chaperone activity
MVTIVETVAYLGLEARTIEVQCQIATGVPTFVLVGLPDKAVAESRERVRAAIAAMGLACTRAPRCGADYQARISGPLLDRIDLFIEVAAVSAVDLMLPPAAEGSAEVRSRVAKAR